MQWQPALDICSNGCCWCNLKHLTHRGCIAIACCSMQGQLPACIWRPPMPDAPLQQGPQRGHRHADALAPLIPEYDGAQRQRLVAQLLSCHSCTCRHLLHQLVEWPVGQEEQGAREVLAADAAQGRGTVWVGWSCGVSDDKLCRVQPALSSLLLPSSVLPPVLWHTCTAPAGPPAGDAAQP